MYRQEFQLTKPNNLTPNIVLGISDYIFNSKAKQLESKSIFNLYKFVPELAQFFSVGFPYNARVFPVAMSHCLAEEFLLQNQNKEARTKEKIWNFKLEIMKSTREEICGCCKRNPVSNNDRLLPPQQSFNMLPPHSLASYKKFHFKGAPRIISIYQYYIYIIYIGL